MARAAQTLVREMGRWDLVAILVNVVIGAGILGLPARTFALIGSYSIPGWIACAVIIGLIAACFAEVGSRFTETGGPYLYAYEVFGPAAGFLVGWLAWISRLFSYATIANLALTYASRFSPALGSGLPRAASIFLGTAALTFAIMAGVRQAVLVNNALTVCKLVLLVGFTLACLPFVEFSGLHSQHVPTTSDWQAALMLMTFAFLGVESAVIAGGEMRNPRRDIPFSITVGLAIIALLYLSIQIVCVGTLPDLATSQRPLVDAAERVFGAPGAVIVNIGALLTMIGTLFAILLTGSRLPFAFAERKQFPPAFAALHRTFKSPYVAIMVTGVCSGLLTLYSSFFGALAVSALTRLVGYATTCAALLVLRRRERRFGTGAFRLPVASLIASLALCACAWLAMASSRYELRSVGLIVLAGVAAGGGYALFSRRRRTLTESPS